MMQLGEGELLLEDEEVSSRVQRQAAIETQPNPNPALDYLCQLDGNLGDATATRVSLRYVPGKLVMNTEALGLYLCNVDPGGGQSLEALAAVILDDLNNELVPRWIQVILIADDHSLDRGHRVLLEDRQPKWDNPTLLSRIIGF